MATIQTLNFTPTSIAGCRLWLDGADSSSLIFSGSGVSQWNDKSGTGNTATQNVGSNRPTYSGRTVVYSGANFLNLPNGTLPIGSGAFSLFMTASVTNTSNIQYLFGAGNAVANEALNIYTDTNTMNLDVYTVRARGAFTSTSLTLLEFFFGSSTLTVYVNGTSNTSFGGVTKSTGSSNNSLGASTGSSGGGQFFMTGTMGETLLYNSFVTTAQREQVEGYLAWKWGLQGSLPTSHPYYYIAPNSQGLGLPLGFRGVVPTQSFLPNFSPLVFFNPLTISNCSLWLDANDSSQVVLSGSNVTTWRDKSGLANTATAVGTITNPAGINGLRVMNYAGVGNTYFQGATTNTGTTLSAFSVFSMNSASSAGARVVSLAVPGQFDYQSASYTPPILRRSTLLGAYRNNTDLGNAAYTFGTACVFSSVYTGTNNTVFVNGTAGTTVATTGNFGYSNYLIGGTFNEESTTIFNGGIGEIILYNASLTAAQRQQVEGYLAWKWGLVGSLPSNHPYKNSPSGISFTLPAFSFQPASFSPVRVSGVQLWLDGKDPLGTGTIPSNGVTVGTWVDKSGNGKNATASGTPTYLSGGGISFNGTNAYYTNTSFSYDLSKRSVFVVLKVNTYLANAGVLPFIPNPSSGSDGETTTGLSIETFTNVLRVFGNNGGYFSDIPNTSLTTVNFYNDNMNGTAGSQFLNGNQSGNPSATYTAGSTSGYGIGARWLSGAVSTQYLLTGTIYEILLFTGPLTTQQRQSVEGYLAWKWALQGNLPATHPFKRFPPPPN